MGYKRIRITLASTQSEFSLTSKPKNKNSDQVIIMLSFLSIPNVVIMMPLRLAHFLDLKPYDPPGRGGGGDSNKKR